MARKDLAGRSVPGSPDPLPVCLLAPKAPKLVYCGFQPLPDHSLGAYCRLEIERLRSRVKLLNPNLEEPAGPHAHRAPDPAQGTPCQEQAFQERTLVLCEDMLLRTQAKGAATGPARRVLFPRVNAALPLILSRSPVGTCRSFAPRASSALPSSSARVWPEVAPILRAPYLDSTTRRRTAIERLPVLLLAGTPSYKK